MSDSKKPTPPNAGPGANAPVNAPVAACPAECPGRVTFHELGAKWGWDDFTDAAVPWMSIQNGKSDTVSAKANPVGHGARMCNVTYESDNVAAVTVSPASGLADNQTLTLTGVSVGEATITAKCNGTAIGTFKVASYDLVTKTVAVRLVHETHYASTDVSDAIIGDYLKKVYKQGVVAWVVTRLPAKTLGFDKNTSSKNSALIPGTPDGKFDDITWNSEEMRIVRDACKDDTYDANVFLINKPAYGGAGIMTHNQRYGYVFPDVGTARKTIAHELGHGAFGLDHTDELAKLDADNIMFSDYSDAKWKLRKSQWDAMH
jgi:hypothetical protein